MVTLLLLIHSQPVLHCGHQFRSRSHKVFLPKLSPEKDEAPAVAVRSCFSQF